MILGLVVTTVAFFGCCGAIIENQCLTLTYASLLLVLIIAEIGAGSFVFASRDRFEKNLTQELEKIFMNGKDRDIASIQESVSSVSLLNMLN